MDITPYVDHLRRDLVAAAAGAGDELRSAAERLSFALDPAARLALMEAISQACAEITAAMPDGGVDGCGDGEVEATPAIDVPAQVVGGGQRVPERAVLSAQHRAELSRLDEVAAGQAALGDHREERCPHFHVGGGLTLTDDLPGDQGGWGC